MSEQVGELDRVLADVAGREAGVAERCLFAWIEVHTGSEGPGKQPW